MMIHKVCIREILEIGKADKKDRRYQGVIIEMSR